MKIKTYEPLMRDRIKITQTIADFWDQTSVGWQTIWGPHFHHGFYENNDPITPLEAQEKLIEKLASMLFIKPQEKILDVGCGIGGSSLYLAKNYQAQMTGITLSQKQIAIATQLAQAENIQNVIFKIEDALFLKTFADNSFDIVWSLESCEQFYDKNSFIQQAFRVLKPGGKLMLATWCSDREEYQNELAKKYRKLCFAFDLPYMPTIEHYDSLLNMHHFEVQKKFDWSKQVEKSWNIGISLANAYSFLQLLKLGGLRGLRFFYQTKMMRDAFHFQRIKYGVFVATKPIS